MQSQNSSTYSISAGLPGNAKTSLKDPNTAVLTQATAEKYFGDWKSAIGKTIKCDNKSLYKITGILKIFRKY